MNKHFNEFSNKTCVGLILMLLFWGTAVYSQQTITGTVTDDTSQSIPGVNIVVQGTTNGVVTDFDGNFSVEASSGDVLVVSYLGYSTKKVTIGNETTLSISLVSNQEQLNDVVVIGYGTAKRKDVTGSIARVTDESYEDQPLTRVEEALQGRTAGVSIQRSNGAPGSGTKVRVRGVNSITGSNDPLVVIDGVFSEGLRNLNPNDIETIDVLKDASALAIYGSRGSNGVILVTTKRGRGKTKITLETFTSVSEVARTLDRLSSGEFARAENFKRIAADEDPIFTNAQIANFDANPIDYEDAIFRKAFSNNVQLSASGGNELVNYFISGNYTNQEGILITNDYERYTLRSNLDLNLSEKFSLGLNIFGSRETDVNNPASFNPFNGGIVNSALTFDPTTPILDEDGDYNVASVNQLASIWTNPVGALERSNRAFITSNLSANINFKYDITDHFSYNMVVGVTTFDNKTQAFILDGDETIEGATGFSRANFNNIERTTHQVSNILNYKNTFGKHGLDVTGVYEFQGFREEVNGYNVVDPNIPVQSFFYADRGTDLGAQRFTNGGTLGSLSSLLGRLAYNFDESLYITGSLRADSSSRFQKDNRTGYFPSVALAYSFNKLSFIEDGDALSNMKLRLGWGQVGNQDVPTTASLDGRGRASNGATFDGVTALPGEEFTRVGNKQVGWETTNQINVGVDFGFANDRVALSVDYFKKNTVDLLLRQQIPTSRIETFNNVGEVENKGIDVSISGDVIRTDNFNWNTSLAGSYVKNQILDLDGKDQIVGDIQAIGGTGSPLNVLRVGLPVGQFYGSQFLGTWKTTDNIPVDATTGEPLYLPGESKYVLDEDGEVLFTGLGSGIPTITWGFNNSINYKNWDLNVFIQGSHDFKVYNLVQAAIKGRTSAFRSDLSTTSLSDFQNAWTPENETDIPVTGEPVRVDTDQYVEDGDFIRLSNVTLGYTFNDLFEGVSAKVYVSGQNLALITDYTGYDPEVTSRPSRNDLPGNQTDRGAGINIGALPNPRVYTVGVKFGF